VLTRSYEVEHKWKVSRQYYAESPSNTMWPAVICGDLRLSAVWSAVVCGFQTYRNRAYEYLSTEHFSLVVQLEHWVRCVCGRYFSSENDIWDKLDVSKSNSKFKVNIMSKFNAILEENIARVVDAISSDNFGVRASRVSCLV